VVRLDTAEPLQLFCLDAYFLAEADLANRAPDERCPVRVQRLVDGRSTGLSPRDRNTSLSPGTSGRGRSLLVTVAEVFDHRGLHRELNQIERNKPDYVLSKDTSARLA